MENEGTEKDGQNPGDVQAGTTPAKSKWPKLGDIQRALSIKPPKNTGSSASTLFSPADPIIPDSSGNGPPRKTPTPPGNLSLDDSAYADAALALKKAFSKVTLDKAVGNKWIKPRLEVKEQLKGALESKLNSSMGDLKTKVKNTKHQQAVSNIQELIRAQFDGLAFKPTKEKLGDFNNWFDKMLDSQKNAFPEDNWVWHDIIKPALMILAGVLFTIATAAIRPFVEGISTYANLFFTKPDSDGFKELKTMAFKVKEETELSLPVLGG